MVWTETRKASLFPAPTGVRTSRSAIESGLSENTKTSGVALERSRPNSGSPTTPFFFGYTSAGYPAEVWRRLGRSNIGARPARTTRCGTSVANLTPDGSAESRRKDRLSTQAKNGRTCVRLCGTGTTQRANGADYTGQSNRTCRSTSTTSYLSPLATFVPTRRTSFSYAKCVTISCIQGRM